MKLDKKMKQYIVKIPNPKVFDIEAYLANIDPNDIYENIMSCNMCNRSWALIYKNIEKLEIQCISCKGMIKDFGPNSEIANIYCDIKSVITTRSLCSYLYYSNYYFKDYIYEIVLEKVEYQPDIEESIVLLNDRFGKDVSSVIQSFLNKNDPINFFIVYKNYDDKLIELRRDVIEDKLVVKIFLPLNILRRTYFYCGGDVKITFKGNHFNSNIREWIGRQHDRIAILSLKYDGIKIVNGKSWDGLIYGWNGDIKNWTKP